MSANNANPILRRLGIKGDVSGGHFKDNKSCIYLAEGPTMHHRTKHMDIRYHYIRECTNPLPGQLLPRARMQYHPTNHMSADVMTKALVRKLFQRHSAVLLGHSGIGGLERPLFEK